MMNIDDLAERLLRATSERTATTPFAKDLGITVDAAYEVQDAVLAKLGSPIVAAKLGLTSVAKQQQMNVDEPLYGWMTAPMFLGGEGQAHFTRDRYIQPRAEPEIAFFTGANLAGPDVTPGDVLEATEAVAPAIDILDSRFTGYEFSLADVTADNASAGGYVIGEPMPLTSDLSVTGCVFEKNGEVIATAAGAAVMGDPAEAMAWFVRKLHRRGRSLEAGSLVLAGAWTAAVPMERGDVVRAVFDRYGTVEVTCR